MVSISRAWRAGASAALLLAACGPPSGVRTGAAPATAVAPVLPPRPLGQVFVLEAAGGSPDDTVVTVPAGERRVIVLRRSAPDFGLFATLVLPAVPNAPGGAMSIRLAPVPGLYSLDVELPAMVSDSSTITFSYGTHFVAPAGARARYGSNLAFEKELAIGRLGADSVVVFLPTSRPGSDMLRAPLAGPGRYLVAAPR